MVESGAQVVAKWREMRGTLGDLETMIDNGMRARWTEGMEAERGGEVVEDAQEMSWRTVLRATDRETYRRSVDELLHRLVVTNTVTGDSYSWDYDTARWADVERWAVQ